MTLGRYLNPTALKGNVIMSDFVTCIWPPSHGSHSIRYCIPWTGFNIALMQRAIRVTHTLMPKNVHMSCDMNFVLQENGGRSSRREESDSSGTYLYRLRDYR